MYWKELLLAQEKVFLYPCLLFCVRGLYEGSLLLAVLRTSIRARGISDITIGQRRNMYYCQLERGVVGRWNNRLPLAIGGTTVPVSGVGSSHIGQRNRCSQLRYRASAIPTTGTLVPVRDYSVPPPPCPPTPHSKRIFFLLPQYANIYSSCFDPFFIYLSFF